MCERCLLIERWPLVRVGVGEHRLREGGARELEALEDGPQLLDGRLGRLVLEELLEEGDGDADE